MKKFTVLVGAQWGSEGKGAVVEHIANRYPIHVRVGGPNAGHSFMLNGKMRVHQSLPVGVCNPDAKLVIGRGAIIDCQQLAIEMDRLAADMRPVDGRVYIDRGAWPLIKQDADTEGGVLGEMHKAIGSTGKGVGAARLAKMSRSPYMSRNLHKEIELHGLYGRVVVCDTVQLIHETSERVLLEGTQGTGLSIVHGPWPFVTSSETTAAGIMADVGVAPFDVEDVIMVARTFPIRVAGNSGPMGDETTWANLSLWTNGYVQPERTTVTKKIRRIAHFNDAMYDRALLLNRPSQVALTFVDYVDPELQHATNIGQVLDSERFNAWRNQHPAIGRGPAPFLYGVGPSKLIEAGAAF